MFSEFFNFCDLRKKEEEEETPKRERERKRDFKVRVHDIEKERRSAIDSSE